MIPIKLCFSAFGPYLERQEITFAPFLASGLVLIRGETGAGKTAILDAMTYALYGRSSGGGRGDLASMRCLAAQPDQETRVEYRFQVRGKEYCFVRWLRIKKKRNGQLELEPAQNVFYRDEEGVDVPFFANPKMRDLEGKAQELIGLTYDQFRQVMILPQGQFERLLTSKSDEKEAILTTLFHAQRWEAVAQWLSDRAQEKRTTLREEESLLEGALSSWEVSTLEELEALAARHREERQGTAAQREEKASALERERRQLEGEQRLEALFLQKEEAEAILADLDRRRDEEETCRRKAERGKGASRLEPVWNQLEQAGKEAARRREEEGLAAARFRQARERWQQSLRQREAGEKLAASQQEQQKELVRLEERLPDYARLDQARRQAQEALARLQARREEYRREQTAATALRRQREELAARREEWFARYVKPLPLLSEEEQRLARGEELALRLARAQADLEEKNRREKELDRERERETAALEELRGRVERARSAYREETLLQLAGRLEEGEPCPLCGSVHHPRLYRREEARHPEGTPENLEKELRRQEEAVRRRDQELLAARVEIRSLEEEAGRLKKEADGCPAEPSRLKELREQLAQARKKAASFDRLEREFRQAEEAWNRAQATLEKLRQEGMAANEEEQRVRAQWETLQSRMEPGIPTEEALRERVGRLRRQVESMKEQQEKLQSRLDQAALEKEKTEAAALHAAQERAESDRRLEQARLDWEAACRREGFAGEEDFRRWRLSSQELAQLEEQNRAAAQARQLARQQLEQAVQAIGGGEKPRTALRRETIAQLEGEVARLDGLLGAADQRLGQLDRVMEESRRRLERLDSGRREAEKLSAFARGLRGSNGISLGRFVLGVMLSSVTAEANRLLEQVHGGRYRLYRTSEGTGRARRVGLELEVLDGFSGKRRSVASLSGGEKFLVALTLALGLSAVVQAQSGGVRMETLFIDEGFGSLDPASIQDALGVLAAVAGSRRLVGIISHVEALEESIPASIQVVKGREGSRLRLRV